MLTTSHPLIIRSIIITHCSHPSSSFSHPFAAFIPPPNLNDINRETRARMPYLPSLAPFPLPPLPSSLPPFPSPVHSLLLLASPPLPLASSPLSRSLSPPLCLPSPPLCLLSPLPFTLPSPLPPSVTTRSSLLPEAQVPAPSKLQSLHSALVFVAIVVTITFAYYSPGSFIAYLLFFFSSPSHPLSVVHFIYFPIYLPSLEIFSQPFE